MSRAGPPPLGGGVRGGLSVTCRRKSILSKTLDKLAFSCYSTIVKTSEISRCLQGNSRFPIKHSRVSEEYLFVVTPDGIEDSHESAWSLGGRMNFLEWFVEKALAWVVTLVIIIIVWGIGSAMWSSWSEHISSSRSHNREMVDGAMKSAGVTKWE